MDSTINTVISNILNGTYSPNLNEAIKLYQLPLAELMSLAHKVRLRLNPNKQVGWIIDRNVNLTNICYSQCSFCNFCVKKGSSEAYVLNINDYRKKIDELYALGGNQLLLQGGMNPELDLDFYETLFKSLKSNYPDLKLHALGPPEIVFLSKKSSLSYTEVLQRLVNAGLDSLPGAGAEILSDRVRKLVSPAKCSVAEWLDVMRCAHKLALVTSATMMFGHIETIEERLEHLIRIRNVQNEKPIGVPGFLAFIPWPFISSGTQLVKDFPDISSVSASEYIRTIAISRIILQNIPHIQASWLTVGKEVGALCLHAGADDMGSIMIEENVVSAAGSWNTLNAAEMQELIYSQGFEPMLRNQQYIKVK
jgi:cyclic dehypoxanthinyl futalosine synthase